MGRYEQALVAYDRAISLNRTDAVFWTNKGSALSDLQRHSESLAAYEQALVLDPKMAEAWSGKGSALYACNAIPRRWQRMSRRWRSIPMMRLRGVARQSC